MQSKAAALWDHLPPGLEADIADCIRGGCEKAQDRGAVTIFFRADDVAVPGRQFSRLMDLFSAYGVPLSLAVVPSALTRKRWQYLKGFEKKNPLRWCWHQHGWRHVNHETEGKKQEFGGGRKVSEIKRDIVRGKERLEMVMGDHFYPVFTPPWNRCSSVTLKLLKELGYAAVSRSRGSKNLSPAGLPDYFVNVDLHTRKERRPAEAWENLFTELQQAIASNQCGIMIHHRMMNDAAFDFLDILLKLLVGNAKLQLVNFRDLSESRSRKQC
jgi:peptidoglycan/xylan/chitin deacetylase (PgdA/CDA1 family)